MFHRQTVLVLAAWCASVAAGSWAMLEYELRPAATHTAEARWPTASAVELDRARPTLVLFLHPHCPCSRATLHELDVLASAYAGKFALQVLLVRPPGVTEDWEQTQLARAARQIRGAVVSCDESGQEAERFGATTSGEALLYAADGRLLFQGGLTAARGHEGDNAGRTAITALISPKQPIADQASLRKQIECARTAVYGCRLIHQPSR
jgi:hypothetical protein